MAVADTGRIFKAFIFDGESSRKYGVYISGEAVYNAPERDVEMITIPNRNGTFVLDKGRFNNIEVRYPAGIFADTEENFAKAVSDLRNFLCSRKGYCKLTDEYNPDEYRMAVYKSGLEITPANRKAGEFEIAFDCKPQRYLETGEIPLTIESGKKIINPTLFEASPMLEIEGYGTININGKETTIENAQLGEIQISNATNSASVTLDTTNLNNGDSIINKSTTQPYVDITLKTTSNITYYSASMQNDYSRANGSVVVSGISANSFKVRVIPKISGFVNGTDSSMTINCFIAIQIGNNSYSSVADITVAYVASTDTVSLSVSFSAGPSPSGTTASYQYSHPAYFGNSSKNILPSPMYIDLDVGEAYGVVNDEIISFDNIVQMPAELPKLKSGANEITYDDTITDLKIVPRWWKI